MIRIVLSLGFILTGFSCANTQSQQCKSVCQQETECAEQKSNSGQNYPYDQEECIAGCVALEHDAEGKKIIEKHVACAQKAGSDCSALMRCR